MMPLWTLCQGFARLLRYLPHARQVRRQRSGLRLQPGHPCPDLSTSEKRSRWCNRERTSKVSTLEQNLVMAIRNPRGNILATALVRLFQKCGTFLDATMLFLQVVLPFCNSSLLTFR